MKRIFLSLFIFLSLSGFLFAGGPPSPPSADQVGTLTNAKWCVSDGSTINCTEDAPAGSGDVTSIGDDGAEDCESGACTAFTIGGVRLGDSSPDNDGEFGFAGNEYLFYGGALAPSTNAYALGSATKRWTSLFLNDGAVINFNNGDVTLTHSANTLTVGGGNLAMGANNITSTGSLGATGAGKLLKIWGIDAEFTNLPTINGGTLATALNLGTAAGAALGTGAGQVPITGDYQAADADLTYLAGFTPSDNVKTILNAANYAAIKSALGYYTSGDTFVGTLTGTASGNLTSANIVDTAYGEGWDEETTNAPSQNAVYDKFVSVIAGYPTVASLHVDDILTALGIASEATHFGAFTGSTIADNQTAKAAIQALETAVEAKVSSSTAAAYTEPADNAILKRTGAGTIGTSNIVPAGPTASRTVTFDDANQTVAARDRDNTFTGANTIGDGGDDQRIVNRINATNERWSGQTLYFAQCAASLAFGTPVYIQSTGKPAGADADAAATMPAIGLIVVASTDADTPCTVLTHGVITDTDWNFTTVGATIYTSETAGSVELDVANISDTNDVVQVLGIALHADTLFVSPSLVTIVLE